MFTALSDRSQAYLYAAVVLTLGIGFSPLPLMNSFMAYGIFL
ncbi:hypothetical protein [Paenibacillus mendelii]|uniref:Uncharacterized protein n=1 Tax=Paenibacillus mendelii TaxID=206163 RepID=A0ABV6JCV6_9BACL|nr:hypothetical protein [Paenibacillus mendelii]MCQ6562622.1 hypothetical protein [Paenibacillus mendelii]